jgi:hypothetical protein
MAEQAALMGRLAQMGVFRVVAVAEPKPSPRKLAAMAIAALQLFRMMI